MRSFADLNALIGLVPAEVVTRLSTIDIALPRRTLSRYLDLLELIFVIKRIPAWSSNGEHQLSFGDRLTALPMAALWTLDSSAP